MNVKYKKPRGKPFRKTYRKSSSIRKTISRVAKTVALRAQETKSIMETTAVVPIYHNSSIQITNNMIDIPNSTSDTGRLGDHVTLRGVKVYLQFQSMYDRPNTTFRVVIGKARETVAGLTAIPRRTITGVHVLDPVDTERVMKVYVNKRYRFGDKDTMIDTQGEGAGTFNRPTTHFRTLWIPLNNQNYQFINGAAKIGRDWNLPMWVAAYDHSSTGSLDHIGDIRVAWELFFKDG